MPSRLWNAVVFGVVFSATSVITLHLFRIMDKQDVKQLQKDVQALKDALQR